MRWLSNTTLEVEGRRYPLDWIRLEENPMPQETDITYDSEKIPRLCFWVNRKEQEAVIYAGECGLLNVSIKNIPALIEELKGLYDVYKQDL